MLKQQKPNGWLKWKAYLLRKFSTLHLPLVDTLKKISDRTPASVISGGLVFLALMSLTWLVFQSRGWIDEWKGMNAAKLRQAPSQVFSLVLLADAKKESQLQAIARDENSAFDRHRARYVLACDLLAKNHPQAALEQLKGLEENYPVLAPYILLKRASAYELSSEPDKAKGIWQQILSTYGNTPVSAEALYQLGRNQPQYWQQLIDLFPRYPRAQAIIRQRLKSEGDSFDWLLLLAKYSADEDINKIRDRLVLEFSAQLTPSDWEAIANGYWEAKEYRKAADAYSFARLMPRNLYRAATGLELNGNTPEAIRAYQKLLREFHDSKEAALALIHLSRLSGGKEALAYLNLVMQKFPAQTPDALLAKIVILNALEEKQAAILAEQKLLKDYPHSDAAAQYRWDIAKKLAIQRDFQAAWQWIEPLVKEPRDNDFAPEAIFWAGKWALKIDRQQEAKSAFQTVIARYPQSYYAWRSAVFLGWDVGDFNHVRSIEAKIQFPQTRPLLNTGSDTFKELFRLAQDRDAWELLQAEIGNREELTVSEKFTASLLLIKQEKVRQGILNIWDLKNRNKPQDKEQWQLLRKNTEYWQTLFPFPYQQDIFDLAQKYRINPLLVISVIRQESTFQSDIESHVGAVGLMQVMPETAKWIAQEYRFQKYDLKNTQDNIKIGTAYLARLHQSHNNNSLIVIASYNAGAENVLKWYKQYGIKDPDIFVKNIPFPETKGYVEGVFGNYWNYLRIYNPEISKQVNGLDRDKLSKNLQAASTY